MKRAVIAAISTAVFRRLNIVCPRSRRLSGVRWKMALRRRTSILARRRCGCGSRVEDGTGGGLPAAQERLGGHAPATGALQFGERQAALAAGDDERAAL